MHVLCNNFCTFAPFLLKHHNYVKNLLGKMRFISPIIITNFLMWVEIIVDFHVKCPLLLFNFNQNRNVKTNFSRTTKYQIWRKSIQWLCSYMWAYRYRKLKGAFLQLFFKNSPKSVRALAFCYNSEIFLNIRSNAGTVMSRTTSTVFWDLAY
jgi:hypothetical protein